MFKNCYSERVTILEQIEDSLGLTESEMLIGPDQPIPHNRRLSRTLRPKQRATRIATLRELRQLSNAGAILLDEIEFDEPTAPPNFEDDRTVAAIQSAAALIIKNYESHPTT